MFNFNFLTTASKRVLGSRAMLNSLINCSAIRIRNQKGKRSFAAIQKFRGSNNKDHCFINRFLETFPLNSNLFVPLSSARKRFNLLLAVQFNRLPQVGRLFSRGVGSYLLLGVVLVAGHLTGDLGGRGAVVAVLLGAAVSLLAGKPIQLVMEIKSRAIPLLPPNLHTPP